MQKKLFNMLFEDDEVTWQTMIYELVKTEQMNPWDIDLKVLSDKFLKMVSDLKNFDFRISGKIILAAAILLRIKSSKLLDEDLTNLNRLIAMTEEEDDFYEELDADYDYNTEVDKDKFRLIPKTPQPRKRKVSVFDLVDALKKALDVKKRRSRFHATEPDMKIPEKTRDITEIIKEIYGEIMQYFVEKKIKKMSFSELIPSNTREDKVYAFMPLLYLDNQRKIELEQEQHLSEIMINST